MLTLDIVAEAVALLEHARRRDPVRAARAAAFARACLQHSRVGRLALGTVEGGPFASRRLVELAALVIEADRAKKGKPGVKAPRKA